ncbi:MAG: pre-16S rRNA-processing nuclease YqgF [Merismopedia sp. SIO2A8]|nr:pre-16S rRNA-processing nuclease YqgF [Symploca sp. SIO2B6]NET49504.1 pre-16S rRNA-processing nuclease YqgF [Merismopedia sp. SIO2A8]
MFLGFDPGREKCGIAVLSANQEVQCLVVVPASDALETVERLWHQWNPTVLIMGDQTTSSQWQQVFQKVHIPVVMVDERYSTLEARDRYWQLYPPQGLTRFMPRSLRSISRPIDDVVALILIERYLSGLVTQK